MIVYCMHASPTLSPGLPGRKSLADAEPGAAARQPCRHWLHYVAVAGAVAGALASAVVDVVAGGVCDTLGRLRPRHIATDPRAREGRLNEWRVAHGRWHVPAAAVDSRDESGFVGGGARRLVAQNDLRGCVHAVLRLATAVHCVYKRVRKCTVIEI